MLRRSPARVSVGVAVLLFYAGMLIGGGHGVAPLGYLLVRGNFEVWWAPQLFGWIGLSLGCAAFFRVSERNWWRMSALSLASLLVSAVLFVLQSETLRDLYSDGPLLIPIFVIFAVRGVQIWIVRRVPSTTPQ